VSVYTVIRSQLVPASPEKTFGFFQNPRNVGLITPAEMRLQLLRIDHPPMRVGTRLEYRIRLSGMPIRWRTLITEYEAGRRFIDEQEKGPYRSWRHEHTFQDVAGGTLMQDRSQYELPLWILGAVVHALFVQRQLRAIFDYRTRNVDEIFRRGLRKEAAG
jgi:ligand-binding SRPBCC domain-containing protein